MTKEFNLEEVMFFDLKYNDNCLVVNVGKNVFYQDLDTFIDCLKNIEQIKGKEKLQTIVP